MNFRSVEFCAAKFKGHTMNKNCAHSIALLITMCFFFLCFVWSLFFCLSISVRCPFVAVLHLFEQRDFLFTIARYLLVSFFFYLIVFFSILLLCFTLPYSKNPSRLNVWCQKHSLIVTLLLVDCHDFSVFTFAYFNVILSLLFVVVSFSLARCLANTIPKLLSVGHWFQRADNEVEASSRRFLFCQRNFRL